MTRPPAYAVERANATGRAYLVSEMGHVMLDVPANRRLATLELGGILGVVKPQREGLADTNQGCGYWEWHNAQK